MQQSPNRGTTCSLSALSYPSQVFALRLALFSGM